MDESQMLAAFYQRLEAITRVVEETAKLGLENEKRIKVLYRQDERLSDVMRTLAEKHIETVKAHNELAAAHNKLAEAMALLARFMARGGGNGHQS